MEKTPNEDFVEVNRNILVRSLQLAEELELFHQPQIAAIETNGELRSVLFDGQPVDMEDTESVYGITAIAEKTMAEQDMQSFKVRIHMSLIGETIQDVKVQEKLTDTDLEGRIEPLLEGLEGTINGATYTFQKTPFNYIESGEHVNIAVSTAQSSSGTVLGRELSITVSDDNVSNSVAIMQIGDENGPLMITKRVNPVYDAEIMEMTQFFTSHNTFDDYKVIMSVFASGLRGDEVQGVADLVEKYADPSDKATIASFVDHMKTRAENHRISQQMKASFVGMDLPSAAELQDIADLMVSVRNI